MDATQKQKGVPYSTSRNEEKLNKKRTNKARRQQHERELGRERKNFEAYWN